MAPFKVAIVGGGMTGLTAALHLHRLSIDFVLLEAYDDITPEVGASLALYPNFQRVLDQLGVLDDVYDESTELCTLAARDIAGKPMYTHHVADGIHAAADGYGIRTWTRSQLLRVLYRNVSEDGKKKIHTSQRVNRIEQLPGDEGVRLHMASGEVHHADLVLGADGTHSIMRAEMWRMAEEAGSKRFVADNVRADAATEFACVFGLSHNTGDLRKDHTYQVTGQDMTIGVFGGAKGEACWFIFFKAGEDKTTSSLDFPRWTPEEGAAVCEKYADAKLSEKTTFGDVYANRYRITTQPCPNHSLRRWHYGRLICLGDAVAKTNPILAQGGAQGAESVVMLVDHLQDLIKQNDKVTTVQLEKVLSEVNKKREPRVRESVAKSQQLIRISAWSTWLFRIIGRWVAPLLPTWVIVAQALGPWKGAYQSTTLPAPQHAVGRAVASEDEAKEPVVEVTQVSSDT
ncbi:uncharacterized protein F5Z01DRAFT_725890 [Emericellopsis atlantica]|uniref:FAD-binding domain-containing protein n=1 Tax=Emericellopsis atlantica TaxID=2614577 RepID=A0A9P7ZJX2_9HYPO|nr:uncharacterized protein F5Z01DRAFT_725890 [Emericellopsis atlantica]KAG9253102.1 hypothetical protein F5Z01DRAFT_725890 [Emericellopsis atlantica]